MTSILDHMPINCPICNGPLINTFKEYPKGKAVCQIKTCFKQSHYFYCSSSRGNEDELSYISISLDPYKKTSANWLVIEKKFYLSGSPDENNKSHIKATYLPYIEPDFEAPTKLINKIRLYCKFL